MPRFDSGNILITFRQKTPRIRVSYILFRTFPGRIELHDPPTGGRSKENNNIRYTRNQTLLLYERVRKNK